PLIVQASIVFGVVLLVEAGLSFLGLGAQPPTASWGSMLRRTYEFVLVHPMHIVPPGAAIAVTVFAFNVVGDGLRGALGGASSVPRHGRLGLTTVKREPAPATAATGAPAPPATEAALLSVDGLSLEFTTPAGQVQVLDRVTFHVAPGETLGLV